MSKLTDIKQKILQLEGGSFQDLCDAYLSKLGYTGTLSLGMKSGSMKTTKGIPDTYFLKSGDKYIFVMYTTQQTKLFEKVYDDICDCFNQEKTGVKVSVIDEIIYCHTSANLSAGKDKSLRDLCFSKGVLLQLKGIDEIANDIYKRFHGISRDFLGVPISTEQIFDLKEFISVNDSNAIAAPLSTTFQFREKETAEVLLKIEKSKVTIISGSAGVGKTRLALECCQRYATTNDYRLFCIKSNFLPIYEDLKVFLDTLGKYLLMIDDANQITGLHHILQYITNGLYDVKVVITVRDYAKKNTTDEVHDFAVPEIYTINVFTDDEIKQLLKVNLKIFNSDYLDKIVKIADGNARLAIIAGKLAVEKQTLGSINDATQLYERYYRKFLNNNILNQDRNLCAVAGIIAFLTAINFEHIEELMPVLAELCISDRSFIHYVHQLHELELVNIYNDKAAKISDQCLGNYLIAYVFIYEKIIPFSVMLKACFGSYRSRVIEATNVLGNIFATTQMYQQLKKEISIVWDDFESSRDPLFFELVKAFHNIRPTETLLMIKEKIDTISEEDFDINTINFKKESKNNGINDDILIILGESKNREALPETLDLLFAYYLKQPILFIDFYHTINRFFGVDKDSHKYDYWVQKQLINKFIEYSDHWKNEKVTILFLKVAAEFLKLHFSPSESGRSNIITIYNIPIQLGDGSKLYRKMIWINLLELYHNETYQLEIETIIKEYGQHFGENIVREMVDFDFQFIFRFFKEKLSPLKLSHCIIAKTISDCGKHYSINVIPQLSSYFNFSQYIIYSILKGERHLKEIDLEKEEELKKSNIRNIMEECNQKKFFNIIQVCIDLGKYDSENTWNFQEGLQYAYSCISTNRELYLYAVDIYLVNNTPINLFPDPIIIKLFELVGDVKTCEIINRVEYGQRNAWQFSFYKNLPIAVISEQYVQSFYKFLSSQEGSITSSPSRDIKFLKKYESYDSNIFIEASKIIVKKYEYSPFMFSIYFGLMFNSHVTDPVTLIDRFKNDWDLLKEIYFKMISYDRNNDYDGTFFTKLIKVNTSFFDEYIKFTLLKDTESRILGDEDLISVIWDCENYIELADKIVEIYCRYEEISLWKLSNCIKNILKCQDKSGTRSIYQDDWISHFINYNYDNSDLIKMIFSAISELSSERRKKYILHLIQLNTDPILFAKLQLGPSIWSVWGSMIPYMEERITFLESLLPALNGLTYLTHKLKIEKDIAMLKRRIEQEQIDEVLEHR